jgi:hypothetical protein
MDNLNAALSPPDSAVIDKLRSRGVAVRFLSEKRLRLDISYAGFKEAISIEDMEPMRSITANVVWLDLSGLHLPPGSLEIVGEMQSLRRLHLERSSITNQGLVNLATLQSLEYLNLYGTSISDEGIPSLARLSALKSIYLWQSSVSRKGVEGLREALPELDINLGSELHSAQ